MAHKQTTFKMAILEGVHKWSWNDLLNQRVVANPEQLGIWASVNVGDMGILCPQHPIFGASGISIYPKITGMYPYARARVIGTPYLDPI